MPPSCLATWREISLLESTLSVLGWDEQVMLPPAGQAWRGEQSALLAKLVHERLTNPALLESATAYQAARTDDFGRANAKEMLRRIRRAMRIPGRLVEELAKATSRGIHVWQEARKAGQFSQFLPELEAIVRLKREEADCVGWGETPYDALLDEYEPGCTAKEVDRIFSALGPELSRLIAKAPGKTQLPPQGPYPEEQQKDLGWKVALAFGFNDQAGRLDVSAHPFCSGHGPGDCRITTRYNVSDFTQSFFGILHETGHALYEQGLPTAHAGEPWCVATSLGMHESQSRFWENLIGRSRAFWDWCWPSAKEAFSPVLDGYSKTQLLGYINRIEPSYIRVEADETSYNLHILLRYRMEKAMIEGNLKPCDLPGAWNEEFLKSFGLKVTDDREGCLQDVHWSCGGIGYFPTYTIGNLLSAQLGEAIQKELGNWSDALARGEFQPILAWLREKVHRHGRAKSALEICKASTGRPLDHLALIRHLEKVAAGAY